MQTFFVERILTMAETNYEKLNLYVQFKNKKDMDEEVSKFRQTIGYELNKTDNRVLSYMQQYAVRYTGVFYQRVKTIAAKLGISESTVKRALRKLSLLGIVKRIPTIRKKEGGKGATIFQFQKFTLPKNDPSQMTHCGGGEKPTESKDEAAKNENKPFISSKQKSLKNINTYSNTDSENQNEKKVVKDFNAMTLYEKMKHLVSITTNDFTDFKRYCEVVFGNTRRWLKFSSFAEHKEEFERIAYQTFKQAIYADNVRKSRVGYLHKLLSKRLDEFTTELIQAEIEEAEVFEGHIDNWLLF